MKNYAIVERNGDCIYFNSFIKSGASTKIVLLLVNLFMLGLGSLIMYVVVSSPDMPMGSYIIVLGLLPMGYILGMGSTVLWNLFGAETVIISRKSISHSKSFGQFSWPKKVLLIDNNVQHMIMPGEEEKDVTYGTIAFFMPNDITGIPIGLFSTSVSVPLDTLEKLSEELVVLFNPFVIDIIHPN
jgi:hypothetical protein